jgi:transposase InsO family protein
MPWKAQRIMSLKTEFVRRATQDGANIASLCREFGISRQTGYKWLRRFKKQGPDGLEERSRRPHDVPLATAEEIVAAIVEERRKRSRWGPTKIRAVLVARFGAEAPSERTIARVLQRFGEIKKRRPKRVRNPPEGAPSVEVHGPNDLWTVDFKGHWQSRDGRRCEPLTVRDSFSRFVLCLQLVEHPSLDQVQPIFLDLFKRYGLPKAIQCDNGAPFIAMHARGGLTRLSAWWIALGIRLVRSRVGCPQDNGAHERMHRDIAGEVEAFPAQTPQLQQRRCDHWRHEFNHLRPHQALGGKVPADLYEKSPRVPVVRRPIYEHCAVRKVSNAGSVRLNSDRAFLSCSLVGYAVGLRSLGGFRFRVLFYEYDLGVLELVPFAAIVSPLERMLAPLATLAKAPLTPPTNVPSSSTSLPFSDTKQKEHVSDGALK